ncbi:MAG: dihydroneopterin aldolase [Candidatus Caenarcaniphilales bacterium]|nr:dihydroneopterin aldolase [Candidatus Caenarcaniphilales bacterium]
MKEDYKKDHISVYGINCFTKIGFADNEREIGQKLRVDLNVYFDLSKAGTSDELGDTVSYIELVKTVVSASKEKDYRLLEYFLSSICEKVFTNFSKINAIGIRVHKPHIPSPYFDGQASVYIYRER